MGPDQTAPKGAVSSGSTLFAEMFYKNHKQMRKQTTIVVIGALRVKHVKTSGTKHLLPQNYIVRSRSCMYPT